ncbi:MAG: hypothetical protein M0017_02970 [Desulfobacteraceae bacterium]|nr:hypothetical protein [Desulfobacteraceae bacterium]
MIRSIWNRPNAGLAWALCCGVGLLLAAPSLAAAESETKKPGLASQIKLDWLFQATGYLTTSKLLGSSDVLGGNGSVVAAPVVQFTPDKALILLYSGSYRKSKQVYAEDEGPKLFSEEQLHSFAPTFRYAWSPKLVLSPSLLYTDSRLKETSDDSWSSGLYNYREEGGGLNAEYTLKAGAAGQNLLAAGVQRFDRTYPNFHSLASLAGIPFEENEKDFTGTLVSVAYNQVRARGLSSKTSLSYLDKDYDDKLVESPTGERFNDRQHDSVVTLGEELLWHAAGPWGYSLAGAVAVTDSNQNLAEGAFPFVTFQPDYYSSKSFTLSPGITYTQPLAGERSITYGAIYAVTRLGYDSRRAADQNGNLLGDKEVDWTHDFTLRAVYTLDKHWSFGAIAEYTRAASNMKDERIFRYDYEILNLSGGFSFRY